MDESQVPTEVRRMARRTAGTHFYITGYTKTRGRWYVNLTGKITRRAYTRRLNVG